MKSKGGGFHLRYLFAKKDYIKYRRLMKTLASSMRFEASDPAQFRLKVLEHMEKFGLQSTIDAFGVKKSTVYDWRKAYLKSQKRLISLVPHSTCPTHTRKMITDFRLISFIQAFREEYGNVGKAVIKPFLDAFAIDVGIPTIGQTTIGKIIHRHHFTEVTRKQRWQKKDRRLRVRRSPKVSGPGLIEMDSIIVNLNSWQYYFISVMDVYTRIALVKRVPSKSAKQALLVFQTFQHMNPTSIHTIQTDNGSEFLGAFDDYLHQQNLLHQFIYPRSPRINGYIERFNRTVQEQCIERLDELSFDLKRFDEKLATYIDWYNYQRPHASLKYMSPMQFITNQIPKCM